MSFGENIEISLGDCFLMHPVYAEDVEELEKKLYNQNGKLQINVSLLPLLADNEFNMISREVKRT